MAGYAVVAEYHESARGIVEFPDDKTWADVDGWFVKWDTLHVQFKGEADWREFELDSTSESDWKRPAHVEVMHLDEGYPDYGRETLAESDL